MRRSPARANSNPGPVASPFKATNTGTANAAMWAAGFPGTPSPLFLEPPSIEKESPLAVRTNNRSWSSSATNRQASPRASAISPSIWLPVFGRSRVRVATAEVFSRIAGPRFMDSTAMSASLLDTLDNWDLITRKTA